MAEHQRERALEASQQAVTRYGPQVRWGAFLFRPSRYGVTASRHGHAPEGTGSPPSFLPFPSSFSSVQPCPSPLRSFLSLRRRRL
jgi:hypothetical protein